MLYILTPPMGNKYLRMTRPIEKVHRNAGCQLSMMFFNLLILALFTVVGVYDYLHRVNVDSDEQLVIIFFVSAFFFVATLVFYFLVMINPGYVQKQPDF